MPVSAVKFTSACLWLFALLEYGWAQDIANSSHAKGVRVPTTNRSPFLTKTGYIRHRRASAGEVTSFCSAPPQPPNGEYKLDRWYCDGIADCEVSVGSPLEPGSTLVYRCNLGYRVEGKSDVICRGRGKWSPIPECVVVNCDSLSSASTTVSCARFGKEVDCNSPVLPETRAEVTCRSGYKKDTEFLTTRRGVVNCNVKGRWEPQPIRCVPDCGVAITFQQPYILGGSTAKIGDFPWHASLFEEIGSPSRSNKVFVCGATIIQTNLLLTAAHCVYDERIRTTADPAKLFVITGNIFRDYDSPLHDPNIVRKATVKNVYTFCNYYGLTGNYASDIALIELQKPFEFSSILLPACLDDSEYRDQFLEPGAYGRVAGFGRTETGATSGILQTITVPYISYSQCRASNNAADTVPFISSDKFCAGYSNGSAVCEGDSGGGLVFRKGDLWYVMGIVSVGLGVDTSNGETRCDKASYSLYTKVSIYMDWIQDVLLYVERKQRYPSCDHDSRKSSVTSASPTTTSGPGIIRNDAPTSPPTVSTPFLPPSTVNTTFLPPTTVNTTFLPRPAVNTTFLPPPTVNRTFLLPQTEDRVIDGRGAISRQKCMEWSQYVKTPVCPASFADDKGSSGGLGKTRAGPMEFPHMAAIGFDRKRGGINWDCGGTLISETFVMTTASCASSNELGDAKWVRLGVFDSDLRDDGGSQNRSIVARIEHPDYKFPTAYNDIALLRLESPVPFNDWIRPACLHTAPTTGTQEAVATGWGTALWRNWDLKKSNKLMKVELPLFDPQTCDAKWSNVSHDWWLPNGIDGDQMICAGDKGRDTCKGDKGGPLVINSTKERCMYDVVGIITALRTVCGGGVPAIYTRVYHYVPWIESIVWK